MAGLRTEFSFTLPKGFVGDDGALHREGTMRLATARDEIEPLRDRTIDGPDDPYLTILVLARVITQLGSLETITIDEIERLFAADLAFLQDLYGIINFGDPADVAALQDSVTPPEAPGYTEVDDTGVEDEENTSSVEDGDGESATAVTDEAPRVRGRGSARIEEVGR
jgi:hypothetical protein